jgi:hypothetical protein
MAHAAWLVVGKTKQMWLQLLFDQVGYNFSCQAGSDGKGNPPDCISSCSTQCVLFNKITH